MDRDRWLVAVAHNTIKVPLERSLPHCSGCSRSAYGPLPARTPQIRSHSLIWTVLVLTIRVSSTDTDYAAARIGVFQYANHRSGTEGSHRAGSGPEQAGGSRGGRPLRDSRLHRAGEEPLVRRFPSRSECLLNPASECAIPRPACHRRFRSYLPYDRGRDSCCGCASQRARPTSSVSNLEQSLWLVGTQPVPRRQQPNPLAPETDLPAITLPVGFTHGMLPAGLTFLGPTFSESTFIRYAYDFEQPTRGAKTPRTFAGLP